MNRKHRHHGGFTIVELLVASTVGLLLVLGVIEAFRQITHAVNKGRANVQLSGKLRNVTNLLREDFRGITVQATPNTTAAAAMGYFEIIEGVDNDSISSSATDTLTGDTDDVIMFTSRRLGEPFSGRFKGEVITSPNAEIIYWLDRGIWDGSAQLKHNEMPLFTLRRRTLLIRPDLNVNGVIIVDNIAPQYNSLTVKNFLNENDISVRVNPDGTLSANTLSDLTLRQNRVAHKRSPAGFPFNPFDPTYLPHQWDDRTENVYSLGEDVVMDQVIGFDVRVYDPLVKIMQDSTNTEPLVPGDPGYYKALTPDEWALEGVPPDFPTVAIGRGAYVDLGFASRISRTPAQVEISLTQAQVGGTALCVDTSYRPQLGNYNVYDTWTIEYERDGLDQDNAFGADQGFNGLDDNPGVNRGVDDATEREAPPPYSVPLRGFQVIVRVFQNSQQQTRQFTVNHDFTPE